MKIVTINVRGLNNPTKRMTIFKWLENGHFDIILLQETFCTSDSVKYVQKDWSGSSFHSISNSNHSKGVSILFSPKLDFKLLDSHACDDGRNYLLTLKQMQALLV